MVLEKTILTVLAWMVLMKEVEAGSVEQEQRPMGFGWGRYRCCEAYLLNEYCGQVSEADLPDKEKLFDCF